MNKNGFYLDFERDLVELEKKIDDLKSQAETDGLNLDEGVRKLEAQAAKKRREIYANLSPWQRVQISRHPNRPYAARLRRADALRLHRATRRPPLCRRRLDHRRPGAAG